MKYCECDIALTLDEHLVLCHDVNFKRLALFDDGQSSREIGELTYRELIALPLKSGACVSFDVFSNPVVICNNSSLFVLPFVSIFCDFTFFFLLLTSNFL